MTQQHATVEAEALPPEVIPLHVSNRSMKNINYLIVDPNGGDAVIVDPAWEMDKIVRALDETQATLRGILVTHSIPITSTWPVRWRMNTTARSGCRMPRSRHPASARGISSGSTRLHGKSGRC
jgi:hydroxyacylglutathione hydrolase